MAYVARLAEFVSPASSARAEKVHSCGSTSHSRSRTERTIYRVCKSVFFDKSLESRLAFRSKKMSAASSTITADLLADPAVAWDFIRTSIFDAANLLGELSSGLAPGSGFLESLSENASDSVNIQLSALSPASLGVIFSAGVVTSLSPCTLSVLPLTLGYIGASASGKSRHEAVVSSIAFCCGLATTLTGMGVAASLTGKALISGSDHIGGSFSTVSSYVGRGLPLGVSFVAVLMGLNLLQVVKLQLPSLRMGNIDTAQLGAFGQALPSTLQAYIAGMTFALVASPCTTPIRATLLSYVAASQDPVIGGGLLLVYTTGYIVPLLLAASFAGVLQQQVQSIRRISGWASSASGALLVGGGVYTLWIQLQAPTTLTAIAATDVSSAAMTLVEHCH